MFNLSNRKAALEDFRERTEFQPIINPIFALLFYGKPARIFLKREATGRSRWRF